ncbi:hypothetical protein RRG08_018048 [Elysia crispata]|uniref:Uncharacterized protein n=1 Tax=Elysia crispata TaxID=231223 RepID=A0AAE1DE58_9GAST|nr:hypothetical protein RRG08_018048 [Elysia crispata]
MVGVKFVFDPAISNVTLVNVSIVTTLKTGWLEKSCSEGENSCRESSIPESNVRRALLVPMDKWLGNRRGGHDIRVVK